MTKMLRKEAVKVGNTKGQKRRKNSLRNAPQKSREIFSK